MKTWQEGQYLAYMEEMERLAREIAQMLLCPNNSKFVRRHRTRLPEIVCSLEQLADRCREEVEQLGLWREDGLELEEVVERIDAEVTRILDGVLTD